MVLLAIAQVVNAALIADMLANRIFASSTKQEKQESQAMEKHLGRASFQGERMRFNDREPGVMSEEKFASELNGADPVRDDGEPVPPAVLLIVQEAEEQIRSLGFGNVSLTFKGEPLELTPLQQFRAASDKRYNPEGAAARAKIGDTSKMSPLERFKALSKLRWGY
jgi:hypothetical protein